jgi:hypothetical protein
MKIDTSVKLTLLAAASLFAACGESEKSSANVTPSAPPSPEIAAVLSETAPAGAVSVVEARKRAQAGAKITVEGIVAGTMSPFAEGFASVVLGDAAMQTCDKIPGDECPTPWDACCAGLRIYHHSYPSAHYHGRWFLYPRLAHFQLPRLFLDQRYLAFLCHLRERDQPRSMVGAIQHSGRII